MTFTLVCVGLAVITGVVTELLPVHDKLRPLVPKVFGLISVVVGIEYYGVTYEEAIGVFGSALASASVMGLVKFTLGARGPLNALYDRLWKHSEK